LRTGFTIRKAGEKSLRIICVLLDLNKFLNLGTK
jgi:hypothetical protein